MSYTAEWEALSLPQDHYVPRFGTQCNDKKAQEQNARFHTLSHGAALARVLPPYKPKDLELFEASEAQRKNCFRGYDKIATNPPGHVMSDVRWNIRPEIKAKYGIKS